MYFLYWGVINTDLSMFGTVFNDTVLYVLTGFQVLITIVSNKSV